MKRRVKSKKNNKENYTRSDTAPSARERASSSSSDENLYYVDTKITEDHQYDPDRFSGLPPELQLRIMNHLNVRDLCNLEQVCHGWQRNRMLNEVWWRHCMAEWWSRADRPRRMERADHKKDWKAAFARLTPPADAQHAPMQDVDQLQQHAAARAARQPQWAAEDAARQPQPGEFKQHMRAFYKGLRAKPLGKRVFVRGVDKHTAFVWADE